MPTTRRVENPSTTTTTSRRQSWSPGEQGPVAIFELDLNGCIASINQTGPSIMGTARRGQLVGSRLTNYVHLEDRERVQTFLRHSIESGTFGEIHFRSSDKSRSRLLSSIIVPLKDPEARVFKLLGVTQDITKRRTSVEMTGLAKSRLQTVVDSIFPFIGLWTVDGIVIDSNLPPLQAAGLSRKDVIGKPFIETYWVSHSPQVQAQFQAMVARAGKGETVREEIKVRLKPDQFIIVDTCITPLRDATGNVVELVGSGTDVTVRNHSQEALRQSEERFRALYEDNPTMYFTVAPNGIVLSVNEFGAEQLGYAKHELIGQSFFTLFPEEDVQAARDRFHALIRNPEKPIQWEFRKIRKDGSVRLIKDTARLVLDSEKSSLVLIVCEDVTEWRETESQKLTLQFAVDQGMEGMAIHDDQGLFTYVNPSQASMYGFEVEELLGQSWKVLYAQDQIDLIEQQHWPRLLADGKWRGNLVGRKKQGSTFDVEVSLTLLKDTHGQPAGLSCTCRDITERKRIEEALIESEKRFDLAVRGSTDGLWHIRPLPGIPWDSPQTPVWWSPRFREMLGYDEEEFPSVFESWISILHPEEKDQVLEAFSAQIKEMRPYDEEHQLRTKSGRYRWFRTRGQGTWDQAGALLHVSGSMQDITGKKQAQKALQQAYDNLRHLSRRLEVAKEQERKRMAQELHDEFGQTLTALHVDLAWISRNIKGLTDRQQSPKLFEKLSSMSNLITDAVHSVRRMATSLRPTLLDHLGLIPALEWQARDFQSRTGITCEVSVCPEIMMLQSNPEIATTFFRIVQELLTNVTRHAQASCVHIRFYEEAEWLYLEVQDDGIGITQDHSIPVNSLGLVGIRERASMVGGKFTISGVSGKGTTALIRILKPSTYLKTKGDQYGKHPCG